MPSPITKFDSSVNLHIFRYPVLWALSYNRRFNGCTACNQPPSWRRFSIFQCWTGNRSLSLVHSLYFWNLIFQLETVFIITHSTDTLLLRIRHSRVCRSVFLSIDIYIFICKPYIFEVLTTSIFVFPSIFTVTRSIPHLCVCVRVCFFLYLFITFSFAKLWNCGALTRRFPSLRKHSIHN